MPKVETDTQGNGPEVETDMGPCCWLERHDNVRIVVRCCAHGDSTEKRKVMNQKAQHRHSVSVLVSVHSTDQACHQRRGPDQRAEREKTHCIRIRGAMGAPGHPSSTPSAHQATHHPLSSVARWGLQRSPHHVGAHCRLVPPRGGPSSTCTRPRASRSTTTPEEQARTPRYCGFATFSANMGEVKAAKTLYPGDSGGIIAVST